MYSRKDKLHVKGLKTPPLKRRTLGQLDNIFKVLKTFAAENLDEQTRKEIFLERETSQNELNQ